MVEYLAVGLVGVKVKMLIEVAEEGMAGQMVESLVEQWAFYWDE